MIIDFHTHCFPEAIAARALEKLSAYANIIPCTDGTASGTKSKMKSDSVDLSVVCNIATNPHQQRKVNEFAVKLNDSEPSLVSLGSLHPDSEEIEEELRFLADNGIFGIKIHPEYSNYYIDDPRWERIFSLCSEMGFFVVTHAGIDFISPDRVAAPPKRLARVLDKFPKLTLIAAHLGGNRLSDEVKKHLCGRDNVYFDTGMLSLMGVSRETVLDVIRSHGEDRILFGSDMPWSEPVRELEFIRSLGISDSALEKILHGNAEGLIFRKMRKTY